jgi:hypothetical protein
VGIIQQVWQKIRQDVEAIAFSTEDERTTGARRLAGMGWIVARTTALLGRADAASVFPAGGHGARLERLLLRPGRPGVRQAKNLEDDGGLLSTRIAICQMSLNGGLLLREPLLAEVIDKLVRV